jgi:hypothetical protein
METQAQESVRAVAAQTVTGTVALEVLAEVVAQRQAQRVLVVAEERASLSFS